MKDFLYKKGKQTITITAKSREEADCRIVKLKIKGASFIKEQETKSNVNFHEKRNQPYYIDSNTSRGKSSVFRPVNKFNLNGIKI